MKQYILLLFAVFIFAACVEQKSAVIFYPNSAQDMQPEPYPLQSWLIIESENGSTEAEIPEWVNSYFSGEARRIENLNQYRGKYVFIGENWGENLSALQQWAGNFTVLHDLPRLVATRVERRFVTSAYLYPDDEYGQYYENLIKKVSDGEFPGAVKEQTFWVKRELAEDITDDDEYAESGQMDIATKLYEYLILVSIDSEILKNQLIKIMNEVNTAVPPTREQAAAINRVQQNFFEGF